MIKFFKNIDGYIFYCIYTHFHDKKKEDKDDAFDRAQGVLSLFHILYIEILFFISEAVLDFDMAPVTGYYIQNKKYIVLTAIPLLLIWIKYEKKHYRKKIANGWLEELESRYCNKYRLHVAWIGLLLFVSLLGTPILYGEIMGTGEWFPDR